jgi:DNA polymerase III subunit delta'
VSFSASAEQPEARLLLSAALARGPAHAYLFHGPAGVGKREAALAFAGALLGDERRVVARTHPDLFVVAALGEMIRIDEVRALHRDLHMRPYEADRRVYLLLDAHLLNPDAADALLKDLEEPPAYAVLVLVADELGPIPPTIRSRCQLVPFRRLPGRAIRELLEERAPQLSETETRALARVSGGRRDRAERLLDPEARARREALLRLARAPYAEPELDPAEAAAALLEAAGAVGAAAKATAEAELEGLDLTAREAEQRLRRVQRGAEREELLLTLEELAAWYRDLVVVAAGAERTAVHADRLGVLREDATPDRAEDAADAAERVRELWRALEEFNLNPALALEALFVDLRRLFSSAFSLSTANTGVS